MTHLCWSIDDWNKLSEVARYQSVVKDPVLVSHALEEGVLRKVVPAVVKLVPCSLTLFFNGVDSVR